LRPESGAHRSRDERPAVYWLQICGFATYCGLMACLLREDADVRPAAARDA
jgi:hypothetical protein